MNYDEVDKILNKNCIETSCTMITFKTNNDKEGAINWVIEKTNCDRALAETKVQEQFDILKSFQPQGANLSPKVKCPYCGSTVTDKIPAYQKSSAVLFGAWGAGASKAMNQWHCVMCGSDF